MTTLGHQKRKKQIIVVLGKNEGSNIKPMIIKNGQD